MYAEGQRRYVESLSTDARQFLQLMDKPDVDVIEGLSPAISIEQKATSHNPRSTVGTVTEIHDYLRLLFARAGTPYCPDHGLPLQSQTVSQMVDAVLALPEDTRLMILAPVAREKKGEFLDVFAEMQAQGYVRFRVDGVIYGVDDLPTLKKTHKKQNSLARIFRPPLPPLILVPGLSPNHEQKCLTVGNRLKSRPISVSIFVTAAKPSPLMRVRSTPAQLAKYLAAVN